MSGRGCGRGRGHGCWRGCGRRAARRGAGFDSTWRGREVGAGYAQPPRHGPTAVPPWPRRGNHGAATCTHAEVREGGARDAQEVRGARGRLPPRPPAVRGEDAWGWRGAATPTAGAAAPCSLSSSTSFPPLHLSPPTLLLTRGGGGGLGRAVRGQAGRRPRPHAAPLSVAGIRGKQGTMWNISIQTPKQPAPSSTPVEVGGRLPAELGQGGLRL